jgi:hypothetical protein
MASRSQPQQDLSVGSDKADLARLLAHPPAALDDLCNDPAIRDRVGKLIGDAARQWAESE